MLSQYIYKLLKRPQSCNFIKKETLAQVFSGEFGEIFNNSFFTEQLRETAFEYYDDAPLLLQTAGYICYTPLLIAKSDQG